MASNIVSKVETFFVSQVLCEEALLLAIVLLLQGEGGEGGEGEEAAARDDLLGGALRKKSVGK